LFLWLLLQTCRMHNSAHLKEMLLPVRKLYNFPLRRQRIPAFAARAVLLLVTLLVDSVCHKPHELSRGEEFADLAGQADGPKRV
jgi:hypothetical protein